ncbi:hypothetical protein L227DRAFT_597195 [Lentinus tigrinus ALCF2SS1-6]|uniref:Uncharacterized protein n=1 Tax=Lentinus tigrinus ALCF2SS1-6 TaxID=1328759 RepID=A0A5C2SVC1_9APHY|nr:hypothetical protein L227DRAFT_597195 [Lentinus tigrinus ALCF2SS1-6]
MDSLTRGLFLSTSLSFRANPTSCKLLESNASPVQFNGSDVRLLVDGFINLPQFTVDGTDTCTDDESHSSAGQAAFICQGLGDGTHELDIQNDEGLNIFLCLDIGATTLSLSSLVSTASAPTTAYESFPTTWHSYSPTTVPMLYAPTSATSSSAASPVAHTAEIVAGTVAGALLVIALAVSGYLLRLRRRRRRDPQGIVPYQGIQPSIPGSFTPLQPRARSPSFEKESMETFSIAEATGPTSAGSEAESGWRWGPLRPFVLRDP